MFNILIRYDTLQMAIGKGLLFTAANSCYTQKQRYWMKNAVEKNNFRLKLERNDTGWIIVY